MASFCAAIRRYLVSLLRFPFLAPSMFYCVRCSLLKTSIQLFFFPFLSSGYFRSVDPRVDSIVSCGCNQSSFAFFYVVFKSLYRCVNAVFNACKSSSSFFS